MFTLALESVLLKVRFLVYPFLSIFLLFFSNLALSQTSADSILRKTQKDLQRDQSEQRKGDAESIESIMDLNSQSTLLGKTEISSASAFLGFGLNQLKGSFRLEKDDDIFELTGNSNKLYGLSFGLASPIYFSRAAKFSLNILAQIGVYTGKIEVRRTGIENYDYQLNYHLLPIDVTLGITKYFTLSTWRIYLSLSAGFESVFISQTGKGDYDTISSFKTADIVNFSLSVGEASQFFNPFLATEFVGHFTKSEAQAVRFLLGAKINFFN